MSTLFFTSCINCICSGGIIGISDDAGCVKGDSIGDVCQMMHDDGGDGDDSVAGDDEVGAVDGDGHLLHDLHLLLGSGKVLLQASICASSKLKLKRTGLNI